MRFLTFIILVTSLHQKVNAQVRADLKIFYAKRSIADSSIFLKLESPARLTNLSANKTLNVKVNRIIIDKVSGSNNYFCWDVCYDNETDFSSGSLFILPNDTVEVFTGTYLPMGNAGKSIIKYCFSNAENVTDSICYIANFTSGGVTSETSSINYEISNNQQLLLDDIYSLDGKLVTNNKENISEYQPKIRIQRFIDFKNDRFISRKTLRLF